MEKIISLIIAIIYVIGSVYWLGGKGFYMLVYLFLPIACIWFNDELSTYTGRLFLDIVRRRTITSESPSGLIKFLGWFLLLLPLIIGIIFLTPS